MVVRKGLKWVTATITHGVVIHRSVGCDPAQGFSTVHEIDFLLFQGHAELAKETLYCRAYWYSLLYGALSWRTVMMCVPSLNMRGF